MKGHGKCLMIRNLGPVAGSQKQMIPLIQAPETGKFRNFRVKFAATISLQT